MKVSIIVPVYSVEKYIKKCLDSLVNQTLEDIEIIVVNDGSPDNSQKKVTRVSIPEISNIIRGLVKKNINWKDDKNWLVQIPENIEGMNIDKYDLYNYYEQDKIDVLISQIRKERRAFGDNYKGLHQDIFQAIEL